MEPHMVPQKVIMFRISIVLISTEGSSMLSWTYISFIIRAGCPGQRVSSVLVVSEREGRVVAVHLPTESLKIR